MPINLPKWLLNATSNIRFSKYPMFIQYKPAGYKIKGFEIEIIRNLIQPADILLRNFNGYLNSIATPGVYSHAGIYIGKYDQVFKVKKRNRSVVGCVDIVDTQFKDVPMVVHALGEGVVSETLHDFCRCDKLCILRPKFITTTIKKAIAKALIYKSKRVGYDYKFISDDNSTVYCTELVDNCLNNLFKKDYESQVTGHSILLPKGIYFSSQIERLVIEFCH